MIFVIDASTLLDSALMARPEWLVAVHDASKAGLRAPSLLASEVGHVVHHKRPSLFGGNAKERSAVVEALLSQVELVPQDAAHREAAGEIASNGLTFYDAEYVALCLRDSSTLVTHDQAMARVASRFLGKTRVLDLDGLRQRMIRSAGS